MSSDRNDQDERDHEKKMWNGGVGSKYNPRNISISHFRGGLGDALTLSLYKSEDISPKHSVGRM
jgi:hypothetical protein